jgi:hypothetical protein
MGVVIGEMNVDVADQPASTQRSDQAAQPSGQADPDTMMRRLQRDCDRRVRVAAD